MSQTTVHNRGSGAGGALGLGHNPPPGSGSNMSAPPVSWSQVLNTASGGSGTSNAQNASATTTHQQQQEVAKASAAGSPQNSNHSGSTLKEHDLLGLSDVSSSSCKEKSSQESLNDEGNESEELNLNLGATELRLGPPAARKRASAIEQQGTPALESGSFLVALDGSQGAKQCVVAAEKSTTTAEQNAAASEHSDRGFNYAPGGRANEMSLLASQGSRMDAAGDNNTSCRPLIESESLMKWHPEQGGDRKAPTEGGLVLGISLLSEKKAFLNSIDRNRELTQEPKQQHERIFQEEESSTEKLQDRSVPSQEQQQQQVAPQQQQERSKLDSYQSSEKRNIIERKSMAPLQQPCPEQRFQSISERSPRMPDSSGRLWQNQVKMHTSNVPEFQSQHPSPQQDIDGRTGYSVPNGAFVVTRSVYVAPKPGVSGAKRNFDAITGSDSRNFSDPRSGLNGPSSAGGVSMNSSNGLSSEAEAKAIAQQQQHMKVQAGMQMYRGPKTLAPPTTWHIGLDQSGGSFGPFPSQRGPVRAPLSKSTSDVGTAAATDSKIWDGQPKSHQEAVPALSQKMPAPSEAKQISSDATPSPAESVSASTPRAAAPAPAAVGWPPLRSFRKNLVVAPRPTPSEAPPRPSAPAPGVGTTSVAGQSNSWFVKVYMDGVPIGRKVDLRTNSSYEKLSQQLDDMFRGFVNGQRDPNRLTLPSDHKRNFLQGSDYVLTYEDQDGDLMLVGDVPWGMFIDTVKRLRIMKGSEAIGLGTRASDKANKTQASV